MAGISGSLEISVSPDAGTSAILVRILGKLVALEEQMATMAEALALANQRLSEHGAALEAAVALLDALGAARGDPAAIDALSAQIVAQTAAIQAATARNTPA